MPCFSTVPILLAAAIIVVVVNNGRGSDTDGVSYRFCCGNPFVDLLVRLFGFPLGRLLVVSHRYYERYGRPC